MTQELPSALTRNQLEYTGCMIKQSGQAETIGTDDNDRFKFIMSVYAYFLMSYHQNYPPSLRLVCGTFHTGFFVKDAFSFSIFIFIRALSCQIV